MPRKYIEFLEGEERIFFFFLRDERLMRRGEKEMEKRIGRRLEDEKCKPGK